MRGGRVGNKRGGKWPRRGTRSTKGPKRNACASCAFSWPLSFRGEFPFAGCGARGIVRAMFLATVLLSGRSWLWPSVALLLAGLGIWGVVSYTAGQRKNEIGVRMALGATPAAAAALVLRQGLRPVVIGAVTGVALAVGATRWIESLLFGVERMDAITYAGAGAVLLLIAAAASAIPARAAARIDPMQSLRAE